MAEQHNNEAHEGGGEDEEPGLFGSRNYWAKALAPYEGTWFRIEQLKGGRFHYYCCAGECGSSNSSQDKFTSLLKLSDHLLGVHNLDPHQQQQQQQHLIDKEEEEEEVKAKEELPLPRRSSRRRGGAQKEGEGEEEEEEEVIVVSPSSASSSSRKRSRPRSSPQPSKKRARTQSAPAPAPAPVGAAAAADPLRTWRTFCDHVAPAVPPEPLDPQAVFRIMWPGVDLKPIPINVMTLTAYGPSIANPNGTSFLIGKAALAKAKRVVTSLKSLYDADASRNYIVSGRKFMETLPPGELRDSIASVMQLVANAKPSAGTRGLVTELFMYLLVGLYAAQSHDAGLLKREACITAAGTDASLLDTMDVLDEASVDTEGPGAACCACGRWVCATGHCKPYIETLTCATHVACANCIIGARLQRDVWTPLTKQRIEQCTDRCMAALTRGGGGGIITTVLGLASSGELLTRNEFGMLTSNFNGNLNVLGLCDAKHVA